MLSCFSLVRLFMTLWTVACQAPLSMGFSRQENWSGLSFPTPGDLPDPGIKPTSLASPALTSRFLVPSASCLPLLICSCLVMKTELPRWLSGKESTRQHRRHGFHPWVRKIPWRRKLQPTPVFLPGKSHGQRSLKGYSPWSHKKVRHDVASKQQQIMKMGLSIMVTFGQKLDSLSTAKKPNSPELRGLKHHLFFFQYRRSEIQNESYWAKVRCWQNMSFLEFSCFSQLLEALDVFVCGISSNHSPSSCLSCCICCL